MTINKYIVKFFAVCPVNEVRIEYKLEVTTSQRLLVEDILSKVASISKGFHEDIADELLKMFGGSQKLVAYHHGVTIETTRY